MALEDPAPLVDLSENTQDCSPQTVRRTGLPEAAGDPESEGDLEQHLPNETVLHGEFIEQLLCVRHCVALCSVTL